MCPVAENVKIGILPLVRIWGALTCTSTSNCGVHKGAGVQTLNHILFVLVAHVLFCLVSKRVVKFHIETVTLRRMRLREEATELNSRWSQTNLKASGEPFPSDGFKTYAPPWNCMINPQSPHFLEQTNVIDYEKLVGAMVRVLHPYCTLLGNMIPNQFLHVRRSKSLTTKRWAHMWWIQPDKTTGKGKNWTVLPPRLPEQPKVAGAEPLWRAHRGVVWKRPAAGGCKGLCCCCFEVVKRIWTHRSIMVLTQSDTRARIVRLELFTSDVGFRIRRRFPHRCLQHRSAVL